MILPIGIKLEILQVLLTRCNAWFHLSQCLPSGAILFGLLCKPGHFRIVRGIKLREVAVTTEPVELYKVLKFEGMATSGGEAKSVIADGQVIVNGKVETRKRRKIVSGDIIEYAEEKILIQLK